MPARAAAILGLIAVLALPCAAAAAPADLDGSFGSGGKSFINAGDDDHAEAVAIQPDGRIVVFGFAGAADGGIGWAAARFTAQGATDTSFGGGDGLAIFESVEKSESANAVVVRPDGRIMLAGSTGGPGESIRVRQLLPSGGLDTGFGQGGKSDVDLGGGAEHATASVLRPDGRLVVAGSRRAPPMFDFAFVAAQLRNPQGDLDPAYAGGTGWSLADMGGTGDFANAVALGPGGKIVVAGESNAATRDFAVTRLNNPEGTFDSTFVPGQGRAFVNFGEQDAANAVAVEPGGGIIVAGVGSAGGNNDFAVAKLTSAGTLDSSFGTGGKLLVNFAGADAAQSVLLQPNGKILVVGTAGRDIGVLRLQPNGQPDATFGNGGKAIFNLGGTEIAAAAALQPDGKIVIAAESNRGTASKGDYAVARLLGDFVPGGGGGTAVKRPRCAGKRATVIGTNKKDRLKGTRKKDVIVALGGNDVVDGKGGNDIVCGGSGKDNLKGSAGKDKVYGQAGKDKESGGAGNDLLDGGAAADRLAGGSGKDKLKGGAGNDRLAGGAAKDRLLGGGGRDRLIGGGGRDLLRGGAGKDTQKQ